MIGIDTKNIFHICFEVLKFVSLFLLAVFYTNKTPVISWSIARISQRRFYIQQISSQQAKIHHLRQCLATFGSVDLSVFRYSHYTAKRKH